MTYVQELTWIIMKGNMEGNNKQISVVIPVFRSERTLETLVDRLREVFSKKNWDYEIIMVDDCSPDNSWAVLKKLKEKYPDYLKIVRLLRNSGQHNAILCGFSLARGDIVVTMDDDLQNPPEEVPSLVKAIEEGYDLAIGAYDSKKHSTARNAGGRMIDLILRKIFKLPEGFQLTSFRAVRLSVVKNVCQGGSSFPYISAMLLANTSKCVNVPVKHEERLIGGSNYNLERSLRLAANLILNYSSYPLYFIAVACGAAFLFAMGYGATVVYEALTQGTSVSGWASLIVIMSLFNGILLLCLAVLALYVSRINQQVTHSQITYTIGSIHE